MKLAGKNADAVKAAAGRLMTPLGNNQIPADRVGGRKMIEAKLLVGRFLQFTPTPKRAYTYLPPSFVDVLCLPLQIEESYRKDFFKNVRESNVITGTNTKKIHRNFKWLPWYEGDISVTDFNCDVLTGPMTGCKLVSYRDTTGAPKVGHVGTITVTEKFPESINVAVKDLWNTFARANPGNIVGGFCPTDNPIHGHGRAQGADSGGETWGLFSTNGDLYTVNVWSQGTNNNWRIDSVHKVTSMTPQQLQNF
jgi:hypothetical protein